MLKLGVNVDHIATVRQARGTAYPDPLAAARLAVRGGADSITIHLREDRRHIQDSDLFALREHLDVPLNLEMARAPEILAIALQARPDEVCLVPERREELTTEGGLDAAGQFAELEDGVAALTEAGIVVSLFIEPDEAQIAAAARLGAPYIELHTGTWCDAKGEAAESELDRLVSAARLAAASGLKVNAGHGITVQNLPGILAIPHLEVLNIGHSIVARAIMVGMEEAVREMKTAMRAYTGGRPE